MITRETLTRLYLLDDAVKHETEIVSELIRTAQDRFGTRTHKIERAGKTIDITEKVLWEETYHLGAGCEAGKILKKEHPEVFSAISRQDFAAKELKVFCATELGLDFTRATLADYLRLMEGVFDMAVKEGRVRPTLFERIKAKLKRK